MKCTAFAPGSIGNVGPGFDVLGLAIEGLGDRVTVELTEGDARIDSITGIDASLVPLQEVIDGADILIIAAPHKVYAGLDTDKPVVDVWNLLGKGVRV